MKSAFHHKQICELCEVTSSKRIFASEYEESGVPFYRGKEIGELHHGTFESAELFITHERFDEIRSKFGAPKAGDLLLTSIGALLGLPYVVRQGQEFYFKDGNVTWFRNFDGLDSRFLYFWMLSPQGKGELQKSKIGSAQPAFTINLLKQMEIGLPPLPLQRRIASILGAYDDLIENNLRRIKILEEMAQSLYREWFVNFRFPGHEKHGPRPASNEACTPPRPNTLGWHPSPLGPIPTGWEVVKFDEAVELVYGKALKGEDREEGPFPVYGSSGVVGYHSSELADGPGIIVGRKGNVGSVFWSDTAFFAIDTVYYVQTTVPLHYVFFNLQGQNFINNDAAVPGLSRKQAYSLPFLRPAGPALVEFERHCIPLFEQTRLLKAKNANLRQTRDLLLPKLISGKAVNSGDLTAQFGSHVPRHRNPA